MHYRSISDMNDTIVSNLHRLPRDIDLVVGVPRSGVLAATLVSLAANIPMTDLDSFLDGRVYTSGITKRRAALDRKVSDMRKVLVIDDSVAGGNAMRDARARIQAAGIVATARFEVVDHRLAEIDVVFEEQQLHGVEHGFCSLTALPEPGLNGDRTAFSFGSRVARPMRNSSAKRARFMPRPTRSAGWSPAGWRNTAR